MNDYPMKKKKEVRGERRQIFNNFQLTLNDYNSDSEVEEKEETTQMAFIVIEDNKVTSSYSYFDKIKCENNGDDLEEFVIKLHDRLRDSYVKSKELKIKINPLLSEILDFFKRTKD